MSFLRFYVAGLVFFAGQPAIAELPGLPRPWKDYRTIMWVGDSVWKKPGRFSLFVQRMREMGINTVSVHGDSDAKPWVDAGLSFYVENVISKGLCLKFDSPVTDWDAFVTRWTKTGRPQSDLVRPYALDDPAWRDWAARRMIDCAKKQRGSKPVAVDIRDELSVTMSANPFDYDFSDHTLKGFRDWLQSRYLSLEALNAGWETNFKSWDDVKPFTTDQIKNRMASGEVQPRGNPDWEALRKLPLPSREPVAKPTAWNLSPWADFRTYMDVSLARALSALRDASRSVDPDTPVGVEGTQMPHAFGGYDLSRLSDAMDWVEPYDICNSREIFGSLMPGKPILTTVGEKDARAAQRRLWHLRLLGDRGCIIWWSEDCIDWSKDDWPLTARAQGLAPVLKAMTSPLAQLFLKAKRETDPVYVHYSQPSIQVAWLMESIGDGASWVRRFSSYEATHSRHARVREGWIKAIQDCGFTPQFVSVLSTVSKGDTVVLPDAWALSKDELEGLRSLPPGSVTGSGSAGLFDEHGKLRSNDAFAVLSSQKGTFGLGATGLVESAESAEAYATERLKPNPPPGFPAFVASVIQRKPPVKVDAAARVYCHRYRLGKARLIAFERNIAWQMSDSLKQAGGNEALEEPGEVTARLAVAAHLYDLRTGKYLGHRDSLAFDLDPWQPSLFAVCEEKLPEGEIVSLLEAQAGP
jgi:hypothetical protein